MMIMGHRLSSIVTILVLILTSVYCQDEIANNVIEQQQQQQQSQVRGPLLPNQAQSVAQTEPELDKLVEENQPNANQQNNEPHTNIEDLSNEIESIEEFFQKQFETDHHHVPLTIESIEEMEELLSNNEKVNNSTIDQFDELVVELRNMNEVINEVVDSSKEEKNSIISEMNMIDDQDSANTLESIENKVSNLQQVEADSDNVDSVEFPTIIIPPNEPREIEIDFPTSGEVTFKQPEKLFDDTSAEIIQDSYSVPEVKESPMETQNEISSDIISLNLIKAIDDTTAQKWFLNVSLPFWSKFQFTILLKEYYQGQLDESTFETIYQIEFSNVAEIGLLSGTVTIVSNEPILLERNELSIEGKWKSIRIQLEQKSNNIVLHGKLETDSPSDDGIHKYNGDLSFQIENVSGNYELRFAKQFGHDDNPCPWFQVYNRLTTLPEEFISFESTVDHQCEQEDKNQMNIMINLKSNVWQMANFHLDQVFNFGYYGDEAMESTHPLMNLAINAYWKGDALYSKTLKLSPSMIGQLAIPWLPANLEATFTRVRNDANQKYTINIDKSSNPFGGYEKLTMETNRLTLSTLVVKIISAFISAMTVVLNANGAILSTVLTQLELIIDQLLSLAKVDQLIPLDIWQYHLALELTIFIILLSIVAILLSAIGLFGTVIRFSLILLFIEICIVTIGIQMISITLLS